MNKWFTGVVTLLLIGTPAPAQLGGHEYTNPRPPSRQVLDRVNLKLAWRTYVPVQGRRDSILTVQQVDRQILVQTVAGLIVSLDADTGVIDWKARIGLPYHSSYELATNQKSVFALRGDHLFSIDRKTGKLEWKFILPDGPTTGAVADSEGVYLVLGASRVYAYILPDLAAWQRTRDEIARAKASRAAKGEAEKSPELDLYSGSSGISFENLAALRREPSPEPELAWDYLTEAGRILLRPLQTSSTLLLASSNGTIVATNKFVREERFRFKASAPIAAPLGQHGNVAYAASEDYNLYAADIAGGRILWRFTAGAPILEKPAVTDRDVFVVAQHRGLFRVDRRDGKAIWHNRSAQHFLAVNRKFVYALDRLGRLLVLDRDRGLQLGTLNTRDFVFRISNERTDRIFLAAHNGLLICLHDHNQKTPLINKTIREEKIEGFKKEEPTPKDKPDNKPKDKPKDKDKEDKDKNEE